MQKIVYSKFSNERNRELAIRTEIVQDDDLHVRCVKKTPLYDEGAEHVLNMLTWEKMLADKYNHTNISINHGQRRENSVVFEYLEGKTLETVLDELYADGKYEELLVIFREYVDIIRKVNGEKSFRITDDFKKIFGELNLNKDLIAADVSNIDMVVGNIIIKDNRWNVIDYEWTFAFPIPVNFIIFRTIFYYVYATAKRESLKELGFYKMFDISDDERDAYLKMEESFQKFITRKIVPVRDMYNAISKGSISFQKLLNEQKDISEKNKVKVYFDYGNGFSEETAQWFYSEERSGYQRIVVGIKPETKALRFDSAEQACLLYIDKIVGKADFTYEIGFQTKGMLIGKNGYLFDDSDPWISIQELREGTYEVCFDFRKELIDENFAEELRLGFDGKKIEVESVVDENQNLLEKLRECEKQLADMKQGIEAEVERRAVEAERHADEIERRVNIEKQHAEEQQRRANELEIINADLNHRLYMAESSFHEIQGSFCWKVTKPIRIVGMGIRAFFRKHYFVKGFLRNIKRFCVMGPKEMKRFNAEERIAKRSYHIYDEISVTCNMDELEAERQKTFSRACKFSVVVPLYNTPELYLRKMIESVLYQTYDNLELCMADGSDKAHRYVKDICKEYRYYDKRIKYKKLKKNMGIADNTNECLKMATGDYIVLFDHDDFLHPSALYENMKAITEKNADFIYTDENTFHETINDAFNPHYKPDFSPDYLRSINYICHLTTFSYDLYKNVGGFRREFDGSQDYDMILRLTEQAKHIVHIPKILYYWRAHANSVAMDIHAKNYCITSAKKALAEHLKRVGLKGTIEDGAFLSSYRIRYELKNKPLVSILIPNKDHVDELKRCIDSIITSSTYDNYEIIIIENNSVEESTFKYYKEIENNEKIRVVKWERKFNYSAINNFGATFAQGEYVLLLNNDVEVISHDWLEEMLMFVQRDDVGAVGAKLYYPNDTIQHAGVIIGIGGVGGHSHKYFPKNDYGYFARLVTVQDLSAVTAACLMVKKSVFDRLNGLDEGFQVAFNDVDFCMRIRQAGYLIVYTPYAELYHYESISRGAEDTPEKVERFNGEIRRFQKRWGEELKKGDPYYNPNLSLEFEDFRQK